MKMFYHFILAGIMFFAQSAFAWGHKGHTIVAEIAFQNLSENAKQNVMRYLGDMTMSEAGNWMDAIKSDKSKDFMKPWHYINLEKGATAMPDRENIITTLTKTLKELDNKTALSDEEIKLRILYLFHLIGDLHHMAKEPICIASGIQKL